jgi:hypothetical protein
MRSSGRKECEFIRHVLVYHHLMLVNGDQGELTRQVWFQENYISCGLQDIPSTPQNK